MPETGTSASTEFEGGPEPRGAGPVAFGALLVAVGAALLLAQTGTLPAGWQANVWPILLMLFGGVRLLHVTRRGREGLFFVVAGAWWLAGVQGWLSLARTWPALIVALGLSVVLQAVTTPPRDSVGRNQFHRRHSGAPWILLAILAGAAITADRHSSMASLLTPNDGASVVAVGGSTQRDVVGSALKTSEVVAVMGRSVLDLTEATLGPGETITVNVTTVMGNTTIRVPEHWTVDVEAVAAFGSVKDNREYLRGTPSRAPDEAPSAPLGPDGGARVVVNGLVMMGSLLITS